MVDEGRSLIQNQGQLILIYLVSAAAGDQTIVVDPTASLGLRSGSSGSDLSIIELYGWHDDTVARSAFWSLSDAVNTINHNASAALATLQALPIQALQPGTLPYPPLGGHYYVLSWKIKATFHVAALAAGKKCYVGGLGWLRHGSGTG